MGWLQTPPAQQAIYSSHPWPMLTLTACKEQCFSWNNLLASTINSTMASSARVCLCLTTWGVHPCLPHPMGMAGRWVKNVSGSPVSCPTNSHANCCPTHHGPLPASHCSLWLVLSVCPGAVLSSKWPEGREKWSHSIRENEDFYRNVQTTGGRRTAPDWPAAVQDTTEWKQDESGDPSEPAQPTPFVCRRGKAERDHYWRLPSAENGRFNLSVWSDVSRGLLPDRVRIQDFAERLTRLPQPTKG